jgi:hypothetical protein
MAPCVIAATAEQGELLSFCTFRQLANDRPLALVLDVREISFPQFWPRDSSRFPRLDEFRGSSQIPEPDVNFVSLDASRPISHHQNPEAIIGRLLVVDRFLNRDHTTNHLTNQASRMAAFLLTDSTLYAPNFAYFQVFKQLRRPREADSDRFYPRIVIKVGRGHWLCERESK